MGCRSELWSVEELRDGSRGRCAVAQRCLAAGTTVVEEDAWATAVLRKELGQRCEYSLRGPEDGRSLLRCKATGTAFRSREDQRAAWREYYEREHRAASASAPLDGTAHKGQVLPPQARLALRTLWRGLSEGRAPWERLQDHWENLDGQREARLQGQAVALVEELKRGYEAGIGSAAGVPHKVPTDVHDVTRLVAALDVNAMVVADEEQRPIALGLYLTGAFFNHSEDPCCAQSFIGRRLVIRTLRPVAIGEELTISYSELAELSSVRRKKLKNQYFFDPLPKGDLALCWQAVFERDRLLTEVLEYDGTIDGGTCRPHKTCVTWSLEAGVESAEIGESDLAICFVRRVHDEWSAAGRILENSGDAVAAARQFRKAWQAATTDQMRLGDCHALRIQVARDGMDAAIDAERWADAVIFARSVATANRQVYPASWPVTGLSLARLAKLELYHCRFVAAVQAGEEALRILTVACDDSLGVASELRQIVAQARAEAMAAGSHLPASTVLKPALGNATGGSVDSSIATSQTATAERVDAKTEGSAAQSAIGVERENCDTRQEGPAKKPQCMRAFDLQDLD